MSNLTRLQAVSSSLDTAIDKAENLPDASGGGGGNDPFASVENFVCSVDAIEDAQYGFALNADGYYESQNKGVANSYAICRVNFLVKQVCDITFDVINFAESNYDYALFGALDTELTLSNSEDSQAKLKKSFKGEQSASVVNLTYESVSVGTHYIDIKFRKDTSADKNNDSVQFKLHNNEGSLSEETLEKIQGADANLIPNNIKDGVNIFGVTGNYVGSGGSIDTCSVTIQVAGMAHFTYVTIGDDGQVTTAYSTGVSLVRATVVCGTIVSVVGNTTTALVGNLTMNGANLVARQNWGAFFEITASAGEFATINVISTGD